MESAEEVPIPPNQNAEAPPGPEGPPKTSDSITNLMNTAFAKANQETPGIVAKEKPSTEPVENKQERYELTAKIVAAFWKEEGGKLWDEDTPALPGVDKTLENLGQELAEYDDPVNAAMRMREIQEQALVNLMVGWVERKREEMQNKDENEYTDLEKAFVRHAELAEAADDLNQIRETEGGRAHVPRPRPELIKHDDLQSRLLIGGTETGARVMSWLVSVVPILMQEQGGRKPLSAKELTNTVERNYGVAHRLAFMHIAQLAHIDLAGALKEVRLEGVTLDEQGRITVTPEKQSELIEMLISAVRKYTDAGQGEKVFGTDHPIIGCPAFHAKDQETSKPVAREIYRWVVAVAQHVYFPLFEEKERQS